MTREQISIERLKAENEALRSEVATARSSLIEMKIKLEALAKRSGEIERSAQLVATQATELARQLRGGDMSHTNTKP